MDKITAEHCDIVMNHAAKYNFAVKHSNTDLNGVISLINWNKAVNAIKANSNYIDSLHSDQYSVLLSDSGRAFLEEGKSFIGEYSDAEAEKEIEKIRQAEIDYKRKLDISYTENQKKTYWWIFWLMIASFVLNTILGIDKLTNKPTIEKVYIPIDRQGKTISF